MLFAAHFRKTASRALVPEAEWNQNGAGLLAHRYALKRANTDHQFIIDKIELLFTITYVLFDCKFDWLQVAPNHDRKIRSPGLTPHSNRNNYQYLLNDF